jgi:hypothetical protein
MTTLAALHFLGAAMNDRVKEVVSRKPIMQEIEAVRKKLVEMRERHPESPTEREAIFRQLLQLEVCETLLNDFHLMW